MADLEQFQKFKKAKVLKSNSRKEIWGYTRVSSKDQAKNFSLEEQEKEIKEYAIKSNYELTRLLGATYESARADISRKDFNKLINDVAKARNKPFAIAIKFINRFSRSGGNAIAIVEELSKVGVHLIETSTGLCTANEHDKLQIQNKLLEAKRENMERLERTIPGMKTLLEQGDWLGKPPRGYILLGTKVVDFSRRQSKQEIIISDEGRQIAKAWKWKLAGERDFVIREKLSHLGVFITKQQISAMWSKPFYCGVSTNALIDEVVKGNWEAMVTHREFMRIQDKVAANKPDAKKQYSKDKIHIDRPLVGTLRCTCGKLLTGYQNNLKGIHYYKCQGCKKANFNAYTTRKSLTEGLNNQFENLLLRYSLKEKLIKPFSAQLIKVLETLNEDGKLEAESLTKQIDEVRLKLNTLQYKFATIERFDENLFYKLEGELNKELAEKSAALVIAKKKISNHSEHVNNAIEKIKNISKIWASGDIENKLRIQRLVFPEGLQIEPKNRQYLTDKVNTIFKEISIFTGATECSNNKKPTSFTDGSCLVAGTGLEPVTFGL
jgi:site-specific DNA recombinase